MAGPGVAALAIAAVSALLVRLLVPGGGRLSLLLRFPSTVLHESAHYAVGFLTGGRPAGFRITPRREKKRGIFGSKERWLLGSVTLRRPGIISALPSALAPLLFLPLAVLLYRHWFHWFPADLGHSSLLGVAILILLSASVPSIRDLEAAFSRPAGVLLYGVGFGVAVLVREQLSLLISR